MLQRPSRIFCPPLFSLLILHTPRLPSWTIQYLLTQVPSMTPLHKLQSILELQDSTHSRPLPTYCRRRRHHARRIGRLCRLRSLRGGTAPVRWCLRQATRRQSSSSRDSRASRAIATPACAAPRPLPLQRSNTTITTIAHQTPRRCYWAGGPYCSSRSSRSHRRSSSPGGAHSCS